MKETRYTPLGEHTEQIGKVTFVVSSFADSKATKTAEELLLQYLENKILNNELKEAVRES